MKNNKAEELRATIIGLLKTRYNDEFLSNETKYIISENIAEAIEKLYEE